MDVASLLDKIYYPTYNILCKKVSKKNSGRYVFFIRLDVSRLQKKKNIICSTESLLALFLFKHTIYQFHNFCNKIPVHVDILSTNVSIK